MGGRQKQHGIAVKCVFLQHTMNQCHGSGVAVVGILASLEHTGIATLEAEREHIKGNIGARLIHNTYHAKRHTHALQFQAIR